jgi:hypothetical protein
MRVNREMRHVVIAAITLIAATAACDDPLALPIASVTNVVDTVTLYALRGTSVVLPSGYDLPTKRATRTDLGGFDFAFDIQPAGQPVVYPAGALGLAKDPGVILSQQAFDAVTSAPTSGYVDSLPISVPPGTVFVVRSRPAAAGCLATGSLPLYGKFRVLSVDPAQRSVMLEALVNQNCGYRSLQPGAPTA